MNERDALAYIASLPEPERAAFAQTLTADEVAYLTSVVQAEEAQTSPRRTDMTLHPWQVPPSEDWSYWLLSGGRGAGKSAGAAVWVYDHVLNDPPCMGGVPGGHAINLVGPTQVDAAETARKDYLPLDARMKLTTRQGGTFVDFPGGATARLLGALTPRDLVALRAAGNVCVTHAEELAWWRQTGFENDAWHQVRISTRLGVHRIVASTTPRPVKLVRELWDRCESDDPRYVLTRGTTYDATHLPADYRDELIALFEGSRLEAQELLGLLLDDVPGALWTNEQIADDRIHEDNLPSRLKTVVGVDPNFSTSPDADEAGIIVVSSGAPAGAPREHAYVRADVSTRGAFEWPKRAVAAYHEYGAYAIVAEANLGGKDYITRAIAAVDPTVKVETVHATQSKQTRAEPYAALYDVHRVHHVGTLPLLEQEQTTWVPGEGSSPNRVDALVWALAWLFPGLTRGPVAVRSPQGRLPTSAGRARLR